MAINGISGRSSYIGSGILNLRSQLDVLSAQLASGRKANTYAGMGSGRSLAIGFRAQISAIQSYSDTAINVNTRLNVATLSLQRLAEISGSVKGAAVSASSTIDDKGQTPAQRTAGLGFIDAVDMLNAQAGDRYLFSGRATDTPPVASTDMIMDGLGAVAGLKKIIAERLEADLGIDGMGRLALTPAAGTAMSLSEDVAGSVFGLKLDHVETTMSGSTVTGPTGTPAQIDIDLGPTNPLAGESIKFTFTLPDGSKETVELKASSEVPLPLDAFEIGVDSTATAANLNAKLEEAVKTLANGKMVAASAMEAGENFFDNPPQRVSGVPLGSATTLTDGTAADTVIWYQGESGADPARATANAKVDNNITINYGARANEQALRKVLQNVAVFTALTFKVDDPSLPADLTKLSARTAQISALNERVAYAFAAVPGEQSIQDISSDFAGAQAAVKSATDRQIQTKAMAQTMLADIEGVNDDEVATKIMALQTALQASYQTTSMLFQMSLVKFI